MIKPQGNMALGRVLADWDVLLCLQQPADVNLVKFTKELGGNVQVLHGPGYASESIKLVVAERSIDVPQDLVGSVPVVKATWILETYAEGAQVDFAQHRLPTFSGVYASSTGVDGAHRSHFSKTIIEGGGQYTPNFYRTCTHLICAKPSGAKYTAAVNWNIPTVTPAWVEQSHKMGYLLPVKEYLVERGPADTGKVLAPRSGTAADAVVPPTGFQREDNLSKISASTTQTNSNAGPVVQSEMPKAPKIDAGESPGPRRSRRLSMNNTNVNPALKEELQVKLEQDTLPDDPQGRADPVFPANRTFLAPPCITRSSPLRRRGSKETPTPAGASNPGASHPPVDFTSHGPDGSRMTDSRTAAQAGSLGPETSRMPGDNTVDADLAGPEDDKANENKEVENDDDDDDGPMFLDGARLWLCGCTNSEFLECVAVIRAGLGCRYPGLCPGLTHIVVGSVPSPSDLQAVRDYVAEWKFHVRVVNVLWLRLCMRAQARVALDSSTSMTLNSLLPKSNDQVVLGKNERSAHPLPLEAVLDPQEASGPLHNLWFTLAALKGSDKAGVAAELVRQGGGTLFSSATLSSIADATKTFAICPDFLSEARSSQLAKEHKDFRLVPVRQRVRLNFLEVVLKQGALGKLDQEELSWFAPLPLEGAQGILRGARVHVSGYNPFLKGALYHVVRLLGGALSDPMTVKAPVRTTHLIMSSVDTNPQKYAYAVKKRIVAVHAGWLMDTLTGGRLKRVQDYPIPGSEVVDAGAIMMAPTQGGGQAMLTQLPSTAQPVVEELPSPTGRLPITKVPRLVAPPLPTPPSLRVPSIDRPEAAVATKQDADNDVVTARDNLRDSTNKTGGLDEGPFPSAFGQSGSKTPFTSHREAGSPATRTCPGDPANSLEVGADHQGEERPDIGSEEHQGMVDAIFQLVTRLPEGTAAQTLNTQVEFDPTAIIPLRPLRKSSDTVNGVAPSHQGPGESSGQDAMATDTSRISSRKRMMPPADRPAARRSRRNIPSHHEDGDSLPPFDMSQQVGYDVGQQPADRLRGQAQVVSTSGMQVSKGNSSQEDALKKRALLECIQQAGALPKKPDRLEQLGFS